MALTSFQGAMRFLFPKLQELPFRFKFRNKYSQENGGQGPRNWGCFGKRARSPLLVGRIQRNRQEATGRERGEGRRISPSLGAEAGAGWARPSRTLQTPQSRDGRGPGPAARGRMLRPKSPSAGLGARLRSPPRPQTSPSSPRRPLLRGYAC